MKKFRCTVCDYIYEGDELPGITSAPSAASVLTCSKKLRSNTP